MRSRQCPQYRLEQDILQLGNSQFISLGSTSRELLYRQKAGTGALTNGSSFVTLPAAQSDSVESPPVSERSSSLHLILLRRSISQVCTSGSVVLWNLLTWHMCHLVKFLQVHVIMGSVGKFAEVPV